MNLFHQTIHYQHYTHVYPLTIFLYQSGFICCFWVFCEDSSLDKRTSCPQHNSGEDLPIVLRRRFFEALVPCY